MKSLQQVQFCVQEELQTNENSRKSDNELIIGVLHRLGVDTSVPFEQLMRSADRPNFESITRARRKIQEDNPDLRDLVTASKRRERELEYRDYAKNGGIGV